MHHYYDVRGSMTLLDMPAIELILLVIAIAIGGTAFGWAAAAMDAGKLSRARGMPMMMVGAVAALGGAMYVILTAMHHV